MGCVVAVELAQRHESTEVGQETTVRDAAGCHGDSGQQPAAVSPVQWQQDGPADAGLCDPLLRRALDRHGGDDSVERCLGGTTGRAVQDRQVWRVVHCGQALARFADETGINVDATHLP